MNNKQLNLITSFVMASISYFILCRNELLRSYEVTSWLIYFMLLILFSKTNITSKDNKRESLVFSIILSIIFVLGNLLMNNMDNKEVDVFKSLFSLNSLSRIIAYFNILFIILKNIFPKLYSIKVTGKKYLHFSKRKMFILFTLIIFICWIPYLLSLFPGTLTSDSISELSQIKDGINITANHHPVLHVLFIGIFYRLSFLLTNNMVASIAVVTIIQMLVLASIFAYHLLFLIERKVKKLVIVIILLCYSFLPMNGYYSIVMWKDVLFAGFLSLLVIECIKLIEKEDRLVKKSMLSFIIISLLCILFRNNAIYMYYILSIVLIILIDKKNKKIIAISLTIVIVTNTLITGPIFKVLNIKQPASSEYIAMPIQQIGRMAFKEIKFDKEETKLLNKLIPIDVMKEAYNPRISDGIKFNEHYKLNIFDKEKLRYLKLYLRLIKKHPSTAIEAYLISTLGYWYPGVEYWSVATYTADNEYDLKNYNILGKIPLKIIRQLESRNFPIICLEWSIGLYTWLLIMGLYISIKKRGIKSLIAFIAPLGILITMFIASPVFGEFRYIYGIVVSLPILLLFPYYSYKK